MYNDNSMVAADPPPPAPRRRSLLGGFGLALGLGALVAPSATQAAATSECMAEDADATPLELAIACAQIDARLMLLAKECLELTREFNEAYRRDTTDGQDPELSRKGEVISALNLAIRHERAATVAGLLAKARVHEELSRGLPLDFLEDFYKDDPGLMAESIANDLLAMLKVASRKSA